MPYIPANRRGIINLITDKLNDEIRTDGELNYAVTMLVQKYFVSSDGIFSYFILERIIGLLECVKLEVYRRLGAPMEDKKKNQNGDVF